MLWSSLCDYSDPYIPVEGTITVENIAAADADANDLSRKVIFKNYAPFTSCISRINNTQKDDAQYIDVVMPMYNLIEHSDNYSKTDFTEANVTESFNLKEKLTSQTGDNRTKNIEIMVPLKYLSNFWKILELPLINCEITLDLNWSGNSGY